jgi:CheY-like chemotaxis protein
VALRVLIVDDSDTTRRILRTLLGSRHWTICEADGGCSGIQKFQKLKPDAVVLDLAMPDLDGIETAKRMSAADPTVPIVLFTILEIEGIDRPAQEAGIKAVISKTQAWNLIGSIENLTNQGLHQEH